MQTHPAYSRFGTQGSSSNPEQDPPVRIGLHGLSAVDPETARGFRRHLPAVALAFGVAVITLNLIVAVQVGAGS